MSFWEWLTALVEIEGGSFAGRCNVFVLLVLVYSLRPKRPKLSFRVVVYSSVYMLLVLGILLTCLGVVGRIGLA